MRKSGGIVKLASLCFLAGVLVAGLLFPVVGGLGVLSNQVATSIEETSAKLARKPPPLMTVMLDDEGNRIATIYAQYRKPLSYEDISPAMKWAIISVEDRRFYEHNGVDLRGIVRAAINNQLGGELQGASTITQQYVKNYLINVVYRNNEAGQHRAQAPTIARKIREARLAIEVETRMTKNEILTGYLNIVEFSRQVYGIAAAAHAYFGTTADQLTVPQAALLAGMVNNPTMYDPWLHPKQAKQRRNFVLSKMVANNKLSPEAAKHYKKQPLGVLDEPQIPGSGCVAAKEASGFYCQYVMNFLTSHGFTREQLRIGGYTIRTTMDWEAAKEANKSAEAQVDQKEDNVANTLSLVRPGKKRHEVVALVANRDLGVNPKQGETMLPLPSGVVNMTGAGSTFKIFTAAAVMAHGIKGIYDIVQSPGYYVSDVFTTYGSGCPTIGRYGTEAYCLTNAYEGYPPEMTLQTALQTSPNTTFVILEEMVGMGPVVHMAKKLGLRTTMSLNMRANPPKPKLENHKRDRSMLEYFGPTKGIGPGKGSFTLGTSPVSGLEMANVAATIVSGGVWCPVTPIEKVIDRYGKTVPIKLPPCEQVVPEGLANTLAVGLSKDVLPGGTASAAADKYNWKRPMIGKTGTTQFNGSAAFVGATPRLAGVAMVFRPDRPYGGLHYYAATDEVKAVPASQGNMFGGLTPARTWFGAMKDILGDKPVIPLPEPAEKYLYMDGKENHVDTTTNEKKEDD